MNKDLKYFIPKLGTMVYCIYDNHILVKTIGWIGVDSFIIDDIRSNVCIDSLEWHYYDYGDTWFTDLDKAKEKLLSIVSTSMHKVKIKKKRDIYNGTYYVVVDCYSQEV